MQGGRVINTAKCCWVFGHYEDNLSVNFVSDKPLLVWNLELLKQKKKTNKFEDVEITQQKGQERKWSLRILAKKEKDELGLVRM